MYEEVTLGSGSRTGARRAVLRRAAPGCALPFPHLVLGWGRQVMPLAPLCAPGAPLVLTIKLPRGAARGSRAVADVRARACEEILCVPAA